MPELNYWPNEWPLCPDICPCDVEFNEWTVEQGLEHQTIHHFGSGAHHIVGIAQAERGNQTISITASKQEHAAYIQLIGENPRLAKNYVCHYGDIYLTNPLLLPEFDVVTMFHLCEYFLPNTASRDYGGLTDSNVLDVFTEKTRTNGHVLFYTRSSAFESAEPILAEWEAKQPVEKVGRFKSLLVYRKR